MLAEKLLAKTDYDCEREVRTLELLKLRFGDANLHSCEVGPRRPVKRAGVSSPLPVALAPPTGLRAAGALLAARTSWRLNAHAPQHVFTRRACSAGMRLIL